MAHVLIAGQVHPIGLKLIEGAEGITFDYVAEVSETSYLPLIARADALVIRTQPLTAATIAGAPRLRMVSRHGVGIDSVDLAALNARGIPLAVVGDVNSRSVAEHAMALILAAAKRLIRSDRAVRGGGWTYRGRLESVELAGRRLLILGYGRSGRHLARMAAGFGMEIEAYDPFAAPDQAAGGPVRLVPDLDAALGAADVVSVHVPRGERPLLGAAEIARMKRGAILVCTSRGGVVDEAALAAALAEGRLGAAGLDVFEAEPPPPDHPLLALDAAVLTPHTAGITQEAMERMSLVSVRNAIDFLRGRLDPALVVNRDALAGPPRGG